MIDKKIFYCWFGDKEKSQLNKDCIESWKKFCPDYEIIEINESNFNCKLTPYSTEGYNKKNWSAVSNTARLEILHNENGFYLDTDIMLLKSLDQLREYDKGFISEFSTGQPDVGILGRGTVNPKLFEMAREHMVKGTTMHKVFLRDLYSLYDIHGESISTFKDEFTVLGEEFIPSIRCGFKNENTIAIHHYENSWIKHPVKITDSFYPYQKVEVYNTKGEKIYQDSFPTVKIILKNHRVAWRNMVLGKINYFFNPKVIRMENNDFIAERIEYDITKSTNTTTTVSNIIVTYYSE